jgi:hypothetical protein
VTALMTNTQAKQGTSPAMVLESCVSSCEYHCVQKVLQEIIDVVEWIRIVS